MIPQEILYLISTVAPNGDIVTTSRRFKYILPPLFKDRVCPETPALAAALKNDFSYRFSVQGPKEEGPVYLHLFDLPNLLGSSIFHKAPRLGSLENPSQQNIYLTYPLTARACVHHELARARALVPCFRTLHRQVQGGKKECLGKGEAEKERSATSGILLGAIVAAEQA